MRIRVDGAEVWDVIRGEQIRMFTFLLDRLSLDHLGPSSIRSTCSTP